MRIFFPCGAQSRFLPARSRWSWSRSASDSGTWREFLRDGVAHDLKWTAARGEGVSTRWSRSRLATDGGAWRAGARSGVPRNFDRLRTATH